MTASPSEFVTEPLNSIISGYVDGPITELQFGLLLALIIGIPLYVKFEDPVPVGTIIALVGGLLFPALPGQVQMIAWVTLFTGLTTAIFGASYKGMIR